VTWRRSVRYVGRTSVAFLPAHIDAAFAEGWFVASAKRMACVHSVGRRWARNSPFGNAGIPRGVRCSSPFVIRKVKDEV